MRKTQCLFCTSRRCHHRIVTPDLKFDEIACGRHIKELERHADAILHGALRTNIVSMGILNRGCPYPFAEKLGRFAWPQPQVGVMIYEHTT
jgi:hypothetical protein